MTYTQEQLDEIVRLHELWLLGDPDGERAELVGADLTDSNLAGADLTRANLMGANFTRAIITRANLMGAIITREQLESANLTAIRKDFHAVLNAAPNEVPALRSALVEGRIGGSAYRGKCACLVGTIANARGCHYREIPGIMPNSGRPAERWFLAIRKGDTPETNPVAAITLQWLDEWMNKGDACSS